MRNPYKSSCKVPAIFVELQPQMIKVQRDFSKLSNVKFQEESSSSWRNLICRKRARKSKTQSLRRLEKKSVKTLFTMRRNFGCNV